jgi:hypothetical protein
VNIQLSFGFSFEDLYSRDALVRLDAVFLQHLKEAKPDSYLRLQAARLDPVSLPSKRGSELIIEIAPYLDDFIGQLFGISSELRALQARHNELAPLYFVKRQFVQRKALTGQTLEKALAIDGEALASDLETLMLEPLTERSFASHVAKWLDTEAEHKEPLRLAALYAAWAALTPAGRNKLRTSSTCTIWCLPTRWPITAWCNCSSARITGARARASNSPTPVPI